MNSDTSSPMRLFFCGDVMTGRGIDQALPHSVSPDLYEPSVTDAREYVAFAEAAHGPIPRPLSFSDLWGDALQEMDRSSVDAGIINLETAITSRGGPWPLKRIHYRMHPENIGCLTVAGVFCCAMANNHVLDWGETGLIDTLQALDAAGVPHTGGGRNAAEAAAPAVAPVEGKGRVLFFAFGSITSGIPREWQAMAKRPGINLLSDLSESTAARIASEMRRFQQPGDLLIASIHWGGNWGHEIPAEQVAFAHRLIDEGIAVVHGHSSHHVKAIEVFKDRLILYGCGDFMTDYEGIPGYESYRGDLALMILAELEPLSGRLLSTRLVPMQMQRFQMRRAMTTDVDWLAAQLNRLGTPFGTRVELANGEMILRWK